MRKTASRRRIHGLICAATGLVIALVLWLEQRGVIQGTLTSWEYRLRDFFTVTGRFNLPDDQLVFVGIDSSSLSISQLDLTSLYADVAPETPEYRALNLMSVGWPWSREVYALLSERLLQAGARGVVFDLLLPKAGLGDDELRATLQKFRQQIVIGSNLVEENLGSRRQAPRIDLASPTILPGAQPDDRSIGYVNFWPGYHGVVRAAQFEVDPRIFMSATPPAALARRGAAMLGVTQLSHPFELKPFRYSGPPGTFIPIPLYQLFVPSYWERNIGAGVTVRDKLVLVGPYGNWTHDEHSTPFGQMPGPELHLNAINALLHQAFLQEWPPWSGYALVALLAGIAWLFSTLIQRMPLRLVSFAIAGFVYLLLVKLAYDYASRIIVAIPPVMTLAISGLGSLVYDYAQETLEKLRIRRTLESYVSRDVVREVLDNPKSYLRSLGGQRTSVAIIVTDLRGFTTMSEQIESTQLVSQLNEYLSAMVEDIFACRGSIDKFIGDAILAVWGHVNSAGAAGDVRNAVEAALKMRRTLRQLNAVWTGRGLHPFEMGCGLNYGEVVFGNIGSTRKMEPTVIGDTVNVTSRLEGLTKDYGRYLLMGEKAAELLGSSYTLQLVDRVVLKGKTQPVRIYTVADELDSSAREYLQRYEEAQVNYAAGNFLEAELQFQRCHEQWPADRLSELYLERCRSLIESPPQGDWNGVHIAEHK